MTNDMSAIMELVGVLQELNFEGGADIKNLEIVTGRLDNGILLKITSPDKDGVKLAEGLARVMSKLPVLLKSQIPEMNVKTYTQDLRKHE